VQRGWVVFFLSAGSLTALRFGRFPDCFSGFAPASPTRDGFVLAPSPFLSFPHIFRRIMISPASSPLELRQFGKF